MTVDEYRDGFLRLVAFRSAALGVLNRVIWWSLGHSGRREALKPLKPKTKSKVTNSLVWSLFKIK